MKQSPPLHPDTRPGESTRTVYKNWREQFAAPLLFASLILGLFALIPAVSSARTTALKAVFITAYLVIGLAAFIRFPYWIRMSIFLLAVYTLGLSELFATGILGDSLFFFMMAIVLSTMMLSSRAGMVTTSATMLILLVTGWLSVTGRINPLNPDAMTAKLQDWLSASSITLLLGLVIIAGFNRLQVEFGKSQEQVDRALNELKEERNNLEANVSDRTRQLRRVNEITRAASMILDPGQLLARIVELIGDEFDCYFTAIFLLDISGQWAELKEASGDAGRALRDNKHRIDTNGMNILATAMRTRQTRLALDFGDDPAKFENPILPYTRSQIAIPLIAGDHLIGALDLQSTKASAFSASDMDTYQNMGNQLAIMLENARHFQEAQQSLSEMRATQRQYIQGAWSSLASEQNLEYHLGDSDFSEDSKEIEIPIALRDQIIGQINMTTDGEWTTEQKNLIETIAAQAALALENARLVEDSQLTASRERLTNEITAKIWSSTSLDAILQTTIRELGRALDATEAVIELSTDPALESGAVKDNFK